MRMLRYLLAAVGALGIAFFLIGVFAPTFSYTNEISIDAPPAKAWRVFTDTSRTGEWMAGFRQFDNLSGNELEVGSQWRITIEDKGEAFQVLETVTSVVPEREFGFTLDTEVMVAAVDVQFTPEASGTRLTSTTVVQGKGATWKSLLWMARSRMKQQGQANYAALKRIIEVSQEAQPLDSKQVSSTLSNSQRG